MDNKLIIFLKGILMGTSDIIPGVSGGTIALIVGIYERLIKAIGNANLFFLGNLFSYMSTKDKKQLKEAKRNFMRMDPWFLLILGSGIFIAVIIGSFIIPYFLENKPVYTFSFFSGLILASAIFIYKGKIKKFSWISFLFGMIGIILGVLIAGLKQIQGSHTATTLFFSGMVAICAMLLPGISGSFILLILGQYSYMLQAVHSAIENIVRILAFVAGAVVGLVGFSRVISYLLKKHHDKTMFFLIGLMLGSMKMLLEKIFLVRDLYPGLGFSWSSLAIILAFFYFALGIFLVALINKEKFKYML